MKTMSRTSTTSIKWRYVYFVGLEIIFVVDILLR